MPFSSREGKEWTGDRIVRYAPETILDVGVGAGNYSELLRQHLPKTRFIGIEVFEPYVERFNLNEMYDQIILADVMDIDPLPTVDIVILGDVLEHLTLTDALTLWDRARDAARTAVFLSLPIVEYPQGEVDGNPHEAHLHTWSHDAVRRLPGIIDWWRAQWPVTVGAYEAKGEA